MEQNNQNFYGPQTSYQNPNVPRQPINNINPNVPRQPINNINPNVPRQPINNFNPNVPRQPINNFNPNVPRQPINNMNPNAPRQSRIDEYVEREEYEQEESEEDKLKKEPLNDSNLRLFFKKSIFNRNVSIFDGQIAIKTFSFMDKIGYGLISIGLVAGLILKKAKEMDMNTFVILVVGGVLSAVTGFIITSIIKSFTVVNYKTKKIYTETYLNDKGIWKSKPIGFNEITELSIDNKPAEASAQNVAMNREKIKENTCDSAIAALLKNGTIIYLTEFSSNDELREAYKTFSSEMARALKVNYKTNFDNYKLVVKKKGPKYYLENENFNKVKTGNILTTIFNVVLLLVIILVAGAIAIYLGNKYL